MKEYIMDLDFDLECPNCKKKIKIKVKEMSPGKKRNCPNCKSEILFSGSDGSKIQKEIDNLEKTMKNLFK